MSVKVKQRSEKNRHCSISFLIFDSSPGQVKIRFRRNYFSDINGKVKAYTVSEWASERDFLSQHPFM